MNISYSFPASLKIPIIEVSDADSVTSDEVQVRLQEVLQKYGTYRNNGYGYTLFVT